MQKNKSVWQKRFSYSALFGALALASATARADQFGLQIAGGVADHDVRKADVGAVWDPNWTWWEIGGFHFTVVGEAHVAYWRSTDDAAVHPNIFEVGITPVIRFIRSTGTIRPFIEAGVGIRLL